VTQLFRLSNNSVNPVPNLANASSQLSATELAALQVLLSTYANSTTAATTASENAYQRLGKPIGCTFIMLGLLFLLMGNSLPLPQ